MSTLNGLVNRYNALLKEDNETKAEFEIRMNITTPKIFHTIMEAFFEKSNPVFEQSIIAVTDRPKTEDPNDRYIDTDRTIMIFSGGKLKEKTYNRKIRLGAINSKNKYGSYSIVLSQEKEIEEFSNNACKLIIVRVRATFVRKNWRFEFNASYEVIPSYIDMIESYKKKMLGRMNNEKFANLLAEEDIKMSLEIEHIPNEELDEVKVNDMINKILIIIDPNHEKNVELQNAIHTISKHIRPRDESDYRSKYGLKKLLPQAITLTRRNYIDEVLPHIEEFYMTPKADGQRCIAFITNSLCQIITADKLIPVNIKSEDDSVSVIDCELIYENDKPKVIPIDIICIRNKSVSNVGFELRYDYFEDARSLLGPIEGPNKPFKRIQADKYQRILEKLQEKEWTYGVDGIIFTKVGSSYIDTKIYKWKPNPTIDFLVRRVPASLQGIAPYQHKKGMTPYILFCGITYFRFKDHKLTQTQGYHELFPHNSRRSQHFPIQFSPPDFPRAYIYYHTDEENLDNKICEFTFEIPKGGSVLNGQWIMKNFRTDRQIELQNGNYFGNEFDVALINWDNLSNPVTFEFLCNPTGYFKTSKPAKYLPLTGFANYVKSNLISQLRNSPFVIDLGSGRGSDRRHYIENNVGTVLFVDKDATALQELKSRSENDKIKHNMKMLTYVADLNQLYTTTLKEMDEFQIPRAGVEGVVCNFALHYMLETKENMNNIIKLIYRLLKPKGRFIFTILDGSRVHDLLEKKENGTDTNIKKGESLDFYDEEILKYSIRRKYSSNKLSNHKNMIELILPFTNGEYYPECLVDVEALITQFEKNGFEREQYSSFKKMEDNFKKHKPEDFANMSPADWAFIKLYSYVSLVKSPKK